MRCVGGKVSRRPGDLEVEASGVGVAVEHLAGEIETRHELGLHRLRIDLLAEDAAAGDDALRHRTRAADGEVEVFQHGADAGALRLCQGIAAGLRRDAAASDR